MNIVVDGLMTNYQLAGKGKLILLLHGWGDSSKGLDGLQQALTKNYKVLALDLPGFGGSETPPTAWDLDDYAAFVSAALAKLDLAEPYALIGHSNGGALAIRAIALGKLKPQKLVLLASAGIRDGQRTQRLVLKIIAKTGNAATIWMPERYRRTLRESLYGAAGSDMLVVPGLEETFKKTVRQDIQADASSLNLPTLIINAANDPTVPGSNGHIFKRLIRDSRLEVVNDAGHFVHRDQPEQVSKLIEEFLA